MKANKRSDVISLERFAKWLDYKAEFGGDPVVGDTENAEKHPLANYLRESRGATLAVVAGTSHIVYQMPGKAVKVKDITNEWTGEFLDNIAGYGEVSASDAQEYLD